MKSSVKISCIECGEQQKRHLTGLTLANEELQEDANIEFQKMFAQAMCPSADSCPRCGGVRRWGDRKFTEVPPILIVELPPEVAVSTIFKHLSDIPDWLKVPHMHFEKPPPTRPGESDKEVCYLLTGATFADGHHYRGAFLATEYNEATPHGWYQYDGLSGQTAVGPRPPKTPTGSLMSYLVYTQLCEAFSAELLRIIQRCDCLP